MLQEFKDNFDSLFSKYDSYKQFFIKKWWISWQNIWWCIFTLEYFKGKFVSLNFNAQFQLYDSNLTFLHAKSVAIY